MPNSPTETEGVYTDKIDQWIMEVGGHGEYFYFFIKYIQLFSYFQWVINHRSKDVRSLSGRIRTHPIAPRMSKQIAFKHKSQSEKFRPISQSDNSVTHGLPHCERVVVCASVHLF